VLDADNRPAWVVEEIESPRVKWMRWIRSAANSALRRIRRDAEYWRGIRPGAGFAAVATWAIVLPLGVSLVHQLDLNPLTGSGAVTPLVVGALSGVLLLTLAMLRRSEVLVGITAGWYSAWVGFVLVAAQNGTPFGATGMRGDHGRLAAMATRFSTTANPVDAFVPSLPIEYPPLFPWVIGRLASLRHQPAWSLLGAGEVVCMSLAVLLAFLLWRRLVPVPVALALAVIPPAIFGEPSKAYEVAALAVFLPWVLGTFAGRTHAEGGLRWWTAGIVGGLILQTYQGPILFAFPGLVALVVVTVRATDDRIRYLLHLIAVGAIAFVVAAWYLVPFLHGVLVLGGERVSDLYVSRTILRSPLGLEPVQSPLLATLEFVGVLGLVFYWRTQWWARPLALVVIGAYVYRWTWLIVFTVSGHTGFLHYTPRLTDTALASAGVLTIAVAAPALWRNLPFRPVRQVGVLACAVLVATAGTSGSATWMPAPPGLDDPDGPVQARGANLATYAHAEPLPSGQRTRFAPRQLTVPWFPVEPIRHAVENRLGRDARPVTLSYDERLFVYLPWPGYVGASRLAANTFTRWDERHDELARIAYVRDPRRFAEESKHTRFGGIDVLVLKHQRGAWMWGDVRFDQTQFSPKYWDVTKSLSMGTVVAVRRPAPTVGVALPPSRPRAPRPAVSSRRSG
jgi:hypothetical protein